ncbi:hypothetical protein ACLSZC_04300 [Avibacterium avium]|uniref:hypothetical protein n=1 Tax=Avibacterium avium TaxID=751 RepID=UPI003BF7C395
MANQFTGDDIDCTEAIKKIEGIDDAGKLTNGSAKARAIAMADYACKYFKAVNQIANRGTEQEDSHEMRTEEHSYKPVTWDVPWAVQAWFKRPHNSGDIEDIVSALPELPILSLQAFMPAMIREYSEEYRRYPASEYDCIALQNNQNLTFWNLIQAGIEFEVRWRSEGGESQPVFGKREGTSDFYSLNEEVVKKVPIASADGFVIAKSLGGVLYLAPKGEDNWVAGQNYTTLTAPTGQIFHASVWKVGEVNA